MSAMTKRSHCQHTINRRSQSAAVSYYVAAHKAGERSGWQSGAAGRSCTRRTGEESSCQTVRKKLELIYVLQAATGPHYHGNRPCATPPPHLRILHHFFPPLPPIAVAHQMEMTPASPLSRSISPIGCWTFRGWRTHSALPPPTTASRGHVAPSN